MPEHCNEMGVALEIQILKYFNNLNPSIICILSLLTGNAGIGSLTKELVIKVFVQEKVENLSCFILFFTFYAPADSSMHSSYHKFIWGV